MDRRVVAGMIGLGFLSLAPTTQAQTAPDPSGLPAVSLAPIPSISGSINNTSGAGSVTPPSSLNPQSPGSTARIPRSPSAAPPVSISEIPTIGDSINRGFVTERPSRLFRRGRPATVTPPNNNFRPMPPAGPPARYSSTRSSQAAPPDPKSDPMAVPSAIPADPETATAAAPVARPQGRPAPYAGQAPGGPRTQAETPASSGAGRPSPLTNDRLRAPRAQAPADNGGAKARPQAAPANAPSYRPIDGPTPVPAPAPVPIVVPVEVVPAPDLSMPAPPPVLDPAPAPAPVLSPVPMAAQDLPDLEPGPIEKFTPPVIPPPETAPVAVVAELAAASPTIEDANVRKVSTADAEAIRMKPDPSRELPFATRRAAAVGDEVITLEELNSVVSERLQEIKDAAPPSEADRRQFINMVAAQALDHMIDQAVIIQEANRYMQKGKAKAMFDEAVDKAWRDDELPPLLRRTASTNEYELRLKLKEQGRSYDALKEAYRKKLLARDFLGSQIKNKVTCDVSEQRAFYNEHLKDYEQPARFSWREVEINVAKYPTRAAARQKADAVLARLVHDEDFAAVARTASDGPTASKGGLYADMTPGSYGIPVVNDELNRLPVGQISQVLEAPSSFHIVRVETRRDAGPLRFDEVQDKIKPQVMERNYQQAINVYLTKLRGRTLIRTMFDNTESDPGRFRKNEPTANR